MGHFEVIQPSVELSPYIKNYWFLKANAAGHTQGVTPTGQISLFFHRGNRLIVEGTHTILPEMYVTGQSTTYTNLLQTSVTDLICISFQPFGARMFFNTPMSEFKDLSLDLNLIEEPELVELGKQLMDTIDNQTSVNRIEEFLKKRFLHKKEYNQKRIFSAVSAINSGQAGILDLAKISCLSYKQFKRIFSEYIGLNPKEFMRVVRFQRALYTLQSNPDLSLTDLAYSCGYYDQSHLINEFKEFSALTPSEYISICDPYSDYFS